MKGVVTGVERDRRWLQSSTSFTVPCRAGPWLWHNLTGQRQDTRRRMSQCAVLQTTASQRAWPWSVH